ncbi:MAG: DHHA1 domain-containing protein [Nitrospirales bacterium]
MKTFAQIPNIHSPEVVLYHAECMDGFGAAWALWKRFPQARYVPVKHGFPPPEGLTNRHVVMVDFSYHRDTIDELADQAASLHILDHHVTAQAALIDLPFAYFDMNRSGAVLAWEWVHEEPVPWLLKYVQDKDLWQWKLDSSREISAALSSYPFEFSVWDRLQFETLKIEGAGILRYENSLLEKITKEAIVMPFAGHEVPVVHSPILASQIGEQLSWDHPFCVIWHQKNGRRFFSLRSRDGGISVAEIAAQFGGGGHTHAAGFSIPLEENIADVLDPIKSLPFQSSSRS